MQRIHPRTPPELARDIQREHVALEAAVECLRAEARRLRAEPELPPPLGHVAGALVMFRVHLARHFALEEENGFLDPELHRPDVRETVEGLVQEHRAMEAEVLRLVHATQCAEGGSASLTRGFPAVLDAFLRRLERHERDESRLARSLSG